METTVLKHYAHDIFVHYDNYKTLLVTESMLREKTHFHLDQPASGRIRQPTQS